MKKVKSILLITMIIATILMTLSITVNASMDFIDKIEGADVTNDTAKTSISGIVQSILAITKVITTGIAIIMLIVLAIKYISAAPGDKADIKKHAVVYVVGAVVLFGAAGIITIIEMFSSNINV